jgi:hypothetical protein
MDGGGDGVAREARQRLAVEGEVTFFVRSMKRPPEARR